MVSPSAILDVHDQLVTTHSAAVVDVAGDRVRVRLDDEVELVDLMGDRTRVRIADLMKNCPTADSPDCLLSATRGFDVVVGHERKLSGTANGVFAATIVVGSLGGLIYCTIECGSPGNYVSGAGVVALVAALVGTAVFFVRGFPHTD